MLTQMIPIGTKLDQITQEQLMYRLHYEPMSGVFTWKVARKSHIGRKAGSISKSYLFIQLHGKGYQVTRLAYLYQNGSFPNYPIEHLDGDVLNNRWNNLKEMFPQKEIYKNTELTQEMLKSSLEYNLETGKFRRLRARRGVSLKKPAGTTRLNKKNKYIDIYLYGNLYQAHRLAWLYVYGEFPKGVIDHINGNGLDNRFINLRDVTGTENKRNSRLNCNSKSKVHGVLFHSRDKIWEVSIGNKGKQIYLGRFKTKEEAIAARKKAELEHGYHPNHGKR